MPTDLVDEKILAHKDKYKEVKVYFDYLVKFEDCLHKNAKWVDKVDLADSPNVFVLYLKAFCLDPTIESACTGSVVVS